MTTSATAASRSGRAGTVRTALTAIDAEISELCARYDARNGNKAVSDRAAARLRQQPLLDFLPLGLPARLPQPARRRRRRVGRRSPPVRPDAATLEDLIAQAQATDQAPAPGCQDDLVSGVRPGG